MPVKAKICGLSTAETLDAALSAGAAHIGLVFFAKSPRNVTPEQAGALAARVAGRAKIVGLFVNPEPAFIAQVLSAVNLDILQLHGDESPALVAQLKAQTGREIWKALPVRTSADLAVATQYNGAADLILYDAKPPAGADLPGGNGLRFDWELLRGHAHPLPWALSGGLSPDNVAEAMTVTNATLVDVSSGVESAHGVKDIDKIHAFLKATNLL